MRSASFVALRAIGWPAARLAALGITITSAGVAYAHNASHPRATEPTLSHAPSTAIASPVKDPVAHAQALLLSRRGPRAPAVVLTGDIRTDMVTLIHRVQDEICEVSPPPFTPPAS